MKCSLSKTSVSLAKPQRRKDYRKKRQLLRRQKLKRKKFLKVVTKMRYYRHSMRGRTCVGACSSKVAHAQLVGAAAWSKVNAKDVWAKLQSSKIRLDQFWRETSWQVLNRIWLRSTLQNLLNPQRKQCVGCWTCPDELSSMRKRSGL